MHAARARQEAAISAEPNLCGKPTAPRHKTVSSPSAKARQVAARSQELRLIKTWQDSEHYAAEYIRRLAWSDAAAAGRSGDEGIDVVGRSGRDVVVAQVKIRVSPIESKIVRELRGAAYSHQAVVATIFALAGYKEPAINRPIATTLRSSSSPTTAPFSPGTNSRTAALPGEAVTMAAPGNALGGRTSCGQLGT